MKINFIQLSNILSFKYHQEISDSQKIEFNTDLNIIVGQNGSGKSTVLEVINFIFKKILFVQLNFQEEWYSQKAEIQKDQAKGILSLVNDKNYSNFKLNPNWDSESEPQMIRIEVELDEIDKKNLSILKNNKQKILSVLNLYSKQQIFSSDEEKSKYVVEIRLDNNKKEFSFSKEGDIGFYYLTQFNLYKKLIDIFNLENKGNDEIPIFFETFSFVGSYRNYSSFSSGVSLGGGNIASKQIQTINNGEYSKSTNTSEQEPSIFKLVLLRMAEMIPKLMIESLGKVECEERANNQEFVKKINEKLGIVNLKIEVKLIDLFNWSFSFNLVDTKRKKPIGDINSLSAGQKSILHLILEAYGRGELKGGLVIIDEPEIHLHYQFQNEYLRIIQKINKEQSCQYVLVTHSEALINSETIGKIKRFSLDENNHTVIMSPSLTVEQKHLIKILDNTRSTHAFFSKKVVLVEGDTDRYFFRAVFDELKPDLARETAILYMGGRDNQLAWIALFKDFGLETYFIGDLDNACKLIYKKSDQGLPTFDSVVKFKSAYKDVDSKIEEKYEEKIYILKNGHLELYLAIQKHEDEKKKKNTLPDIIRFCADELEDFLNNEENEYSREIRFIIDEIAK